MNQKLAEEMNLAAAAKKDEHQKIRVSKGKEYDHGGNRLYRIFYSIADRRQKRSVR